MSNQDCLRIGYANGRPASLQATTILRHATALPQLPSTAHFGRTWNIRDGSLIWSATDSSAGREILMITITRPTFAHFALTALVLLSGADIAIAGPKAYVGNFADSTVSVIDTTAGKVVATIPVAEGPHGMVMTPDDRTVFVAGDASSKLSVIDTASDKVIKTIEVGKSPNGITLTPDARQLLVTVIVSAG